MRILKYSEWADTATALHMVLQMMGKIKLKKMHAQPEWNHVLIYATAQGFTTGLIPNGDKSFDISVNIGTSMVYAHCTDGAVAGFPFRNQTSVSEYYADFKRMLKNIGNETDIYTVPQEVADTTPFEKQTIKYDFDCDAAASYFENCIFARNALLSFASPFRGKKILPALFWGTFDMTTVLFSGVEHPFPGEGIIEQVAFDEKFMEFGYWPGDTVVDEPSFFVLPYPFLQKDLGTGGVSPKEAIFSAEKKEYFLPARDVLKYDDPMEVLKQFCCDTFDVIAKAEDWQAIEWFNKPLLI